METKNVHIGARVRAVIAGKGISQADLARILEKSTTYVARLLKKETVDTSTLNSLCSKLGHNFFMDFNPSAENRGRFHLTYPHAGNLVASKLREKKVTQAELGQFLGVTHQEVSRLLKGESIDTGRLFRISAFLDCDLFAGFYCDSEQSDEELVISRFSEFLTASVKETGLCYGFLRSVIRDYLNEEKVSKDMFSEKNNAGCATHAVDLYRNSLWHDASQKPERRKEQQRMEILVYKEYDSSSSFYTALYNPDNDMVLLNDGRWYKLPIMNRWAYMEDLIADDMKL